MTVKDKRILNDYYKRRFYSGRGAFARAADFIALRLILFIAFYLWFSFNTPSALISVVLSAASLGAICVLAELIKAVRLERFIEKENADIARRLFIEGLCMLPRDEFMGIIREHIRQNKADFGTKCLIYAVQTASPIDEETVLRAYRASRERGAARLAIFSASTVSEAARAIASRCDGIDVVFTDAKALSLSAQLPDLADVHAYILTRSAENRRTRRKRASNALGAGRAVRYALCAAVLFTLSFFVSYSLYYRSLAMASASLATLSLFLNRTRSNAA